MHAIKLCLLVSILLHSSWALSIPITDTVRVNDKEWAQIDLFANLNWSDMRRACGSGECADVQLNGFDMLGWHWGGLSVIKGLFNAVAATSFFDIDSGVAEGCFDCDDAFTAGMFDVGFRPTGGSVRIFDGFMAGNCRDLGIVICSLAYTGISIRNTQTAYVGDYIGNIAVPFIGGWFYRDALQPVSAPSSIALVLLGIAVLRPVRAKKLATARSG